MALHKIMGVQPALCRVRTYLAAYFHMFERMFEGMLEGTVHCV